MGLLRLLLACFAAHSDIAFTATGMDEFAVGAFLVISGFYMSLILGPLRGPGQGLAFLLRPFFADIFRFIGRSC